MSALTIEIVGCLDWGCDHTPDDVAAFGEAVCAAVLAAYPTAEVSYDEESIDRTRVEVGGVEDDREIVATVREIHASTWENAAFWAPAP